MSEPMRKTADELKRLRLERVENQKDLEELAETKAKILVLQVRRNESSKKAASFRARTIM